MKIMQITQPYPPMISGASLAVAQLAQGLARLGHDLLVIAASDRSHGYSTQNGHLRVDRLTSLHNPARVDQRFLVWPQRQVSSLVKEFEPDVIHLHDPVWLGVCGLRAAQKYDVPVVSTLHQLPWFVTKYTPAWWGKPITVEQLLWQYGKWFVSQCTASIVPMTQIAAEVKRHTGIEPYVIPYGADLEKFHRKSSADEAQDLRIQLGLLPDKPVMLHVGRLDLDKGVDRVVRAAAQVMQQVDAHLLIVGDGRQRQALLKLCEELGIRDQCHFTGFISPDVDLPAIYRLADVFVTASEIETFGIVVLEAMAAACPVVAVDATCIPELVDHNRSGFLLPAKDANGLAAKITWLLQNPAQAHNMGLIGQEISRKFNQESMFNRHIQLYESIQPLKSTRLTGTNQLDLQDQIQISETRQRTAVSS